MRRTIHTDRIVLESAINDALNMFLGGAIEIGILDEEVLNETCPGERIDQLKWEIIEQVVKQWETCEVYDEPSESAN